MRSHSSIKLVIPTLCYSESRVNLTKLKGHIYSVTPESSLSIGKRSEGHVSNYYIGEVITDEEVAAVQQAAEKLGIDILNTRYGPSFSQCRSA